MSDQTSAFDDLPEEAPIERVPSPLVTILVHFAEPADRLAFEEAVGQRIPITRTMWYPKPPEVVM